MGTESGEKQLVTVTVRLEGRERDRRVLRSGGALRVGRDDANDIVIDDPSVSRLHAIFSSAENGIAVTDLSSTNGTFVNGERVNGVHALNSGDVVDIGSAKLTLEFAASRVSRSGSGSLSRTMTATLKPVSVSIMVASLANFTELVDEVPTQALAELQFRWADRITRVVQSHGGRVEQVAGASVVGVWSAAEASTLACGALRAALAARAVAAGDAQQEPAQCETSVVVSSGAGLKGVLGSRLRGGEETVTVLGDPTALAFRLQELCKERGQTLLISEPTWKLVREEFSCEPLGSVPSGDESQPLQLFTVSADGGVLRPVR